MKEHKFDKKESWKKLNAIYMLPILYFCVTVRQSLESVAFYLHQEKLFSYLGMNLVPTFTTYNHIVLIR